MATAKLKVTGMTCGHCVSAVKSALESTTGVESAQVDLNAGTAFVQYDEARTTPQDLTAAVMQEGYQAEEEAN